MPVFITLHKDGIALVIQPYLFRKTVIAQIFCTDLPELASAVFINGDDGLLSAAVRTETLIRTRGWLSALRRHILTAPSSAI